MRSKKFQVLVFAIISGCFMMSSNAVSVIIPLRMIDQGLSYDSIGAVMASFSVGMLVVKMVVGRHSDLVGQKFYLIISVLFTAVVISAMVIVNNLLQYVICLCCLGVCRGMFTSVNTSYTIELTDYSNRGKGFGNIYSISSIITSLGGVMAGFLYKFGQGKYAFAIIALLLFIMVILVVVYLPNPGKQSSKLIDKFMFKGMSNIIYLFCIIMFLQTFVTTPMWDLIVPMHFYVTFGLSAALLGIVMSLDEFIASPTYLIAGFIADKINAEKLSIVSYILASIVSVVMIITKNPMIFLISFLASGFFLTFSYISIPKAESKYLRNEYKGFELGLISLSAAAGQALGNLFIGKLINKYSINAGIICFLMVYLFIAVLLIIIVRTNPVKEEV